jgi:hypothetical protein
MNPMYDFTDKEIALLDMAISSVIEATKHAVVEGHIPPEGLVEALMTTYGKLQQVIEIRDTHNQEFSSVIELLKDVETTSQSVISNPDLPINEYN